MENGYPPGTALARDRGVACGVASSDDPRWQICDTPLGPLHVRRVGTGEPTLVWHSAYVDSHSFDRLIPLFPEREWILIDGPGHGRSPAPPGRFSIADCADAAAAVIDQLGLESVDWVGNAWGGHTGVTLAIRPDSPIRTLAVLCAPMQPPTIGPGLRAMMKAFPIVGLVGPLRSGLVGALLDQQKREADPELEAYVVRAATGPDTRGLVRALESVVVNRTDLVAQLDRIRVPTLFLTGDNPLWPVAQARVQLARVPQGRFAHLAGVRHLPQLEDPAGTAEALRAFWVESLG